MNDQRVLSLTFLETVISGLSKEVRAFYAQATMVCLSRHSHSPGIELSVEGSFQRKFEVSWNHSVITDDVLRSWEDADEATEFGACGLAFLLVWELTPFRVIRRSRKGTGFDYWLGDKEDSDILPLSDKARLEVSGIGTEEQSNQINRRMDNKINQLRKSESMDLPAIIVIVDFTKPLAYVVKL